MDGLTGLNGLTQIYEDTPQATAEQRSGDAADERHAIVGETSYPLSDKSYLTQASDSAFAGPEDGLVDETTGMYGMLAAGSLEDDPTSERPPWTHAAPWPKDPIGDQSVRPDNIARQLEMSAAIHAVKAGGKRNVQSYTLDPLQDDWRELWVINPGNTDLTTVPNQIKSGAAPGGRGGTDRTQTHAKQNEYGFDSSHMHRRYAAGSLPGNYMWMKPGGRPLTKSVAGPARPATGSGSPFEGDNLGMAFNADGAILQVPATEYQPPPVPFIAPLPTGNEETPTDSFVTGGY